MTPRNWGRAAVDGVCLVRANENLDGIATHDAEENIYPAVFNDDKGGPFSDSRRYVVRFEKGKLPPVSTFWSLTLYGLDYNLVENSANRYSIVNRTRNLKYDPDGSLTICIQKDAPGGDKDSNGCPPWPAIVTWCCVRACLPRPEALDGRWQPPPVKRVH